MEILLALFLPWYRQGEPSHEQDIEIVSQGEGMKIVVHSPFMPTR
jgi:hypothetical protein